MRSTPLPPVACLTCAGQAGIARVDREIAAELREPRPPRRIGRGAHHHRGAHQLADLQAHQADAGARALDQQALAALEAAGGDDRVVHGLQRDGKARGLGERHVVGGDAMQAHVIGDDVFRMRAGRRAHHAIAGLEALDLAADRLDLAGAFEADPRALAADRAVLMP